MKGLNVGSGETIRVTFIPEDFKDWYGDSKNCALANALRRRIGGNPFIIVRTDSVTVGVRSDDPNKMKFHIIGKFDPSEYDLMKQLVNIEAPGSVYKDLKRIPYYGEHG